jgi:hypothetical protein
VQQTLQCGVALAKFVPSPWLQHTAASRALHSLTGPSSTAASCFLNAAALLSLLRKQNRSRSIWQVACHKLACSAQSATKRRVGCRVFFAAAGYFTCDSAHLGPVQSNGPVQLRSMPKNGCCHMCYCCCCCCCRYIPKLRKPRWAPPAPVFGQVGESSSSLLHRVCHLPAAAAIHLDPVLTWGLLRGLMGNAYCQSLMVA